MIKVECNVVDGHASDSMVRVNATGIDAHREFHAVVLSTAKAIMQAAENVGGYASRHHAKTMLLATLGFVIDEIEKM